MQQFDIKGLFAIRGFLEGDEQVQVVREIDRGTWCTQLRRRVQHFGYRYDYGSRRVDSSREAAPIPEWATRISEKILKNGLSEQTFDQLIVNEYLPGQGIAPHVDCTSCFDNDIASISLLSYCLMSFSSETDGVYDVLLGPGDLLVLRDEARFQWRHGIKRRKADSWLGSKIPRDRRVSLTFRTVLPA